MLGIAFVVMKILAMFVAFVALFIYILWPLGEAEQERIREEEKTNEKGGQS